MDYIFINTDVYLQTDIDFSKIPFENTTIVVPQLVIDEIQKSNNKRKENVLSFINDGKNVLCIDDDCKDITESITKFNCEDNEKYLVTFSIALLSKNMYRNLLNNSEFARQMTSTNLYEIFAKKLNDNIANNVEVSASRFFLSECYLNDKGVDKDIDKWENELETSANNGFDVAQYNLGFLCQARQEFREAEKWYKKAVEQGNPQAKYYLGILYLNGVQGVQQNLGEAKKLIIDAAKEIGLAQYKLGLWYYEGKILENDLKEAVKYLELAAQKGIVEAQNMLGKLYFNGEGVDQNTNKAIEWTTKAARKHFPDALYNLGLYYESENKYNEAFIWYEKSAQENNNSQACYKLGEFYEFRNVIDKDKNPIGKATQWYQKAYELGNEQAKLHLDAINRNQYIEDIFKNLSISELQQEHSRAEDWYVWCVGVCAVFIVVLLVIIFVNLSSNFESMPLGTIIIRIFATITFMSFIFISINQAARQRKSMILLAKEIQEYKYIERLLKAKSILSINSLETNKEISKTISKMIQIHLDIQKERIGKEDNAEVKDITFEMLSFIKDNTNTVLSNYNDMYKIMANTFKGEKQKNE